MINKLISLVIALSMLTGCTVGWDQGTKKAISEGNNKSSKTEKAITKSSNKDENVISNSSNIMGRFPQNIILKENHIEKVDVLGAKKIGQKHQISINKFFLDVSEKIVAMNYKKQYVDNKIIIETEDGSIKYELAVIYEGNSYLLESNKELSKEYDKLWDDYYNRNNGDDGFNQSEQLLTYLQKHKELLPDLVFTDVKQRYDILKNTFKIDREYNDVGASDGYNKNFDFAEYAPYKFIENGYKNVMYLCRNKEGIYAIRTVYKEGSGVLYPEDEIEIATFVFED